MANAFNVPTISYADQDKIIKRWGVYPPNPEQHVIFQDRVDKKVTSREFLEAMWEKLKKDRDEIDKSSESAITS